MPYALDFSETAVEDLERLIDSLPASRREKAIERIEAACQAFCERPEHSQDPSPPTFRLNFEVDGVRYYWTATYRLGLDEGTLIVTHVFRTPPL